MIELQDDLPYRKRLSGTEILMQFVLPEALRSTVLQNLIIHNMIIWAIYESSEQLNLPDLASIGPKWLKRLRRK